MIGQFEQQGDLVNKWTILVYAGFNCIGFLGAFLMFPSPGNEESATEVAKEQTEELELIQAFREFLILLQDPKYVVTAISNSYCFSMMVYFISLITPIAKARELENQTFVLVTIFSASNTVAMLPMGLLGDSSLLNRIFKFPKKSLYIFWECSWSVKPVPLHLCPGSDLLCRRDLLSHRMSRSSLQSLLPVRIIFRLPPHLVSAWTEGVGLRKKHDYDHQRRQY